MSCSPTRGHDNAIILQFQRKLREEWTIKAVCGRPYVLVEQLQTWIRSKERPDSHTTRAGRLLGAAYRNWTDDFQPVLSDQLSTGADCCLLVFSILLTLDCGDLVHLFQRWNIVDRNLPRSLSSLRAALSKQTSYDAEDVATRFEEEQWHFCPGRFELDVGRDYTAKWVVPICNRELINSKGETAEVSQVMVQEEFVGCKLRAAAMNSKFEDPSLGSCYQFALKTFRLGNIDIYKTELNAFHGLRNQEGMVRCFGDYTHEGQGDAGETTYNILLDFADLDLDEFFAERPPPILPSEIVNFWKDLFGIAEAVQRLHNLGTCTDGLLQEYHGWHADIKPDNILSVQGEFKLADFGSAKFKPKIVGIPVEFMEGGANSCVAPECDSGRQETPTPVSQTIDIWSLGCVFSIAATWVVLGYHGICQFISVRTIAIQKIFHDQRVHTGDRFHDGRHVLPAVKDWHNVLRSAMRKTDTITSRVLDLVDEEMLLEDSPKRVQSKDLCVRLAQILSQAQAEPREPIPKIIVDALLEVEVSI